MKDLPPLRIVADAIDYCPDVDHFPPNDTEEVLERQVYNMCDETHVKVCNGDVITPTRVDDEYFVTQMGNYRNEVTVIISGDGPN